MVNKNKKYSFKGMNRDIANSKHPENYLYEANSIRFLTTDQIITGGFSFEKGNKLIFTVPDISIDNVNNIISYGNKTLTYKNNNELDQQIDNNELELTSSNIIVIGHTITRNSIILFTTDDNNMDCIWEVSNDDYSVTLLYLRNLGFKKENPIQAIFNYENENIQKIYWVDGNKQIRTLNLKYSSIEGNEELIDVPSNSINFVGTINLSQPIITNKVQGGSHTSGMIQYAYNLYKLNSSQTKISPLSELTSLDKGNNLGGGDLNEIVGSSPVVTISNLDTSYTNINIYAIKYTSYNQLPSINLIKELELNDNTSITFYDDGSTISSLSLEEFAFLGSDPIIPKHIESKENRLFLSNIKDASFDIPKELDCRAYSFPISSTSTIIYENITSNSGGVVTGTSLTINNTYNVPYKHDSVNLDYDNRKYQYNSTTIGGTGKYIQYELVQKTSAQLTKNYKEYQFLKDEEIYRIGIQFYNNLGQTSPPKWIADFKTPSGNLQGNYNTLKVELLPAFYTWLNTYNFESTNDKPIGYKIIRADRTLTDRTIICQGALTQMMCQTTKEVREHEFWKIKSNRETESDNVVKLPIPISRGFTSNINPLGKTDHLKMMNEQSDYGGEPNTNEFPNEEIYSGIERDFKRQQSWQYTKLFQLNSPDILFNTGLRLSTGLKLKVKGLVKNTKNDIWEQRIQTVNENIILSIKKQNISHFFEDTDIHFLGLFGPSKGNETMNMDLINREYNTFISANNRPDFSIYGSPEVTERGQGITAYNGDNTLKYQNTMAGFLTDASDNGDEQAITSMNSYGNKCITLAESTNKTLEEIYNLSSIGDPDGLLLSEIVLPKNLIYLSNIYGGNSYEDKTRTSYIEIGEYNNINNTSIQIDSAGDTFIYNYKFARISKTDTKTLDDQVLQLTEIVEYPIESTVDLKNRNDNSLFEWDSEFQPTYDRFHNYNRVYSQQSNLIQNSSINFNFRKINSFDTRIIATKLKTPNEDIDSWTDILINEVMDLDGKYGPINGLVNFKDNIFAFQDNAFALININPRVQVQGSDGISLELGSGGILYDYKYISTKSGCINKWGMLSTENSIYYLDGLNKRFYRFNGSSLEPLSEIKGMHSFFENLLLISDLRLDNPFINGGVSMGYDQKNNDVYLTYNNIKTIAFNELLNEFTSFYYYNSPMYIFNKEKFFTLNPSNKNTIYETHAGKYNEFYGNNRISNITFIANPEADHECIFNNLEYKSEALSNNQDYNYTWEKIQVWNEFQNSTLIELNKIRKLNRKYRLNIPRQNGTRDRIRNNWCYIKLESSNEVGYFYLNHDIILHYITNYIIIQ